MDGREVRDLCIECGINRNIKSMVWHYATRLARGVRAGSRNGCRRVITLLMSPWNA